MKAFGKLLGLLILGLLLLVVALGFALTHLFDPNDYKDEIRAIGDVLRDQLFLMRRCGFDAFAVRADRDPYDALEGLKDFSVTYQAAADDPRPLFLRRG
jgi:uncharacterized protein (DUF934 family)